MAMLRIVLVQPGATDFDEQGRIKGSLDIPLSRNGSNQVDRTVLELESVELDAIYVSPCESALQTAAALAKLAEGQSPTYRETKESRSRLMAR